MLCYWIGSNNITFSIITAKDFEVEERLLSIQAPNTERPVIHIENDAIAEYSETFLVILSSNDDNVMVPEPTSVAEIHIIDNDSKFTTKYIHHDTLLTSLTL